MIELRRFPSLEALSAPSRALLDRTRKDFELPPRQIVIRCGERTGGTYFLSSGWLRVFIQDEDGHQRTLYRITPGQTCILAVNCSFSGVAYPAWVASGEETTRGFFVPSSTFRTLFAEEAPVRDFTIEVLSSWIFDLMTTIEEDSLGSISRRLAHLLIRRADDAGVVRGTQQDLAHDLGTAREVVSRHLGEFERKGWIRKERRRIQVLDAQHLLAES